MIYYKTICLDSQTQALNQFQFDAKGATFEFTKINDGQFVFKCKVTNPYNGLLDALQLNLGVVVLTEQQYNALT